MGRICVMAMDHNSSTVQDRADFTRHASDVGKFWSDGLIGEYLRLETCNRNELYMVLTDPAVEKKVIDSLARPGTKTMFDYEAVRHLLRVLLGLESMAKGESHIVAQVKEAYRSSKCCGKVLHRLFQRATGMAASLRACHHPGRAPSMPYIAAKYFLKNYSGAGAPSVMVAGLGAIGVEMASVLLLMGCRVSVSNRSARDADGKISGAQAVPWEDWKARCRSCAAVFLCTSAETPILSSSDEDAMPDTWVVDLGSPHQSEPRGVGVRLTLDDMNDIASDIVSDYDKLLVTLEEEADKTSSALLAEISVLTDDTWKQLALARARAVIKSRAPGYAKKTGACERDLEGFAELAIKAFLHPLISARAAHSSRAWRILSGEGEEGIEE